MKPKRTLFGLCLAAFLALPDAAAAQGAKALSEHEKAEIARLETYLNAMRTARARFVQVSSHGGTAEGTFYLARPGKLRIEYDPPVPILLVSDGSVLTMHDSKLNQTSQVPLSLTPAQYLVRENVRFSDDLTVSGFDQAPGAIRITVFQTKDPGAGSISMVFSDAPLALRQWQVIDGQGVTTRIALIDARFGVDLDGKLFQWVDPNAGKFHND